MKVVIFHIALNELIQSFIFSFKLKLTSPHDKPPQRSGHKQLHVGLIWYSHNYTSNMRVASLGLSKLVHHSIAILKHAVVTQLFLCLRTSVSSFGHKKTRGKKGGSKKAQKGCELRYFTVGSTKHKTECSTSYKTECSTSYEDVCSQHTVTEYVKKCRSDIVAQPVESCTVEVENHCEKKLKLLTKMNVTLATPRSAMMINAIRFLIRIVWRFQ